MQKGHLQVDAAATVDCLLLRDGCDSRRQNKLRTTLLAYSVEHARPCRIAFFLVGACFSLQSTRSMQFQIILDFQHPQFSKPLDA